MGMCTVLLDNSTLQDNTKLYSKYIPSDVNSTGYGRFNLPFNVNPYGFKIITKTVNW